MRVDFHAASNLAQENIDACPTARINQVGIGALADWLDANTKTPHNHHAWYGEAEAEASNLLAGIDASLEIRGLQSRSGNPATLKLQPAWFDWELVDAASAALARARGEA